MNMAEAKQKLMKIAGKEYHSIEYKMNDHGNGNVNQTCTVYMHGHGSFEAPHWDAAIAALESAVSGGPKITEEIPFSKADS